MHQLGLFPLELSCYVSGLPLVDLNYQLGLAPPSEAQDDFGL